MSNDRDVMIVTADRIGAMYRQVDLRVPLLSRVALKPTWNVVESHDGGCGIAMSFTNTASATGSLGDDAEVLRSLIGKDLLTVAETLLPSASLRFRSVGVAALSALSQPLLKDDRLVGCGFDVRQAEGDVSSLVRPDDVVAMVGYGGIINRLIGKCRHVHVAEMRPRDAIQTALVGEGIQIGPPEVTVHAREENESVLGAADVVFITASTLVNGTFEQLVRWARKARLKVLYGPTASIFPAILFERGLDLAMTFAIEDPARLIASLVDVRDMGWSHDSIFSGQRMLWLASPSATAIRGNIGAASSGSCASTYGGCS